MYFSFAQHEKTFSPLKVTITSGVICADGECKPLTATVTGGTPPYTFHWNTNEQLTTITPCNLHSGDRFYVQVEDSMNVSVTDTVVIIMGTRPNLVVKSTPTEGCALFCPELQGSGAFTYEWFSSSGDTLHGEQVKICLTDSKIYTAIGTSVDGCKDTAFLPIEVFPIPEIHISGRTNICQGDTVKLTATATDAIQYLWEVNKLIQSGASVILSPDTTGFHKVIVKSKQGCFNIDSIQIKVTTCTGIPEHPLKTPELTIYPNPFETIAHITFFKEQTNATLRLTDITGKEVRFIHFSGKQIQLEKENLKPGLYFIEFLLEGNTFEVEKIIIQ